MAKARVTRKDAVYLVKRTLEKYVCALIGCSSAFAKDRHWPQRICNALEKHFFPTWTTSGGRVLYHHHMEDFAREALIGYPVDRLATRKVPYERQ